MTAEAVSRDALLLILRQLSPSAPFEMRARAIQRVDSANPEKKPLNEHTGWRPRWWDDYPEGQMAAFVFRVARLVNDPSGWITAWEWPGEELPQ